MPRRVVAPGALGRHQINIDFLTVERRRRRPAAVRAIDARRRPEQIGGRLRREFSRANSRDECLDESACISGAVMALSGAGSFTVSAKAPAEKEESFVQ